MGALFALIPLRDKLWAAGVIALVAFGWYEYEHLQHVGAAKQLAAEQAASAKVQAEAAKTIANQQADYDAKLKATQEAQNVALQEAANESAGLAARLRVALTARCPGTVLQGAAPAAPSAATGAGSAGQAQPGSAADASVIDADIDAIIAAAAHDNAICEGEREERDALTGK